MPPRTDIGWKGFLRDPSEAHFAPVYEATRDLVWTICLRLLRREEDAADAFQGAYARLLVWAANPTADPPVAAGPEAVMRRFAVLEADRLRKRRSRRLAKEVAVEKIPVVPDPVAGPDREAARAEIRGLLESLIDQLPDRYRVPLLLHFFHGMTHREIAEALGKPPTTISSQITRGLRRLEPMARRAGVRNAGVALGILAASTSLASTPSSLASTSGVFAEASWRAASLQKASLIGSAHGSATGLGAEETPWLLCYLACCVVILVPLAIGILAVQPAMEQGKLAAREAEDPRAGVVVDLRDYATSHQDPLVLFPSEPVNDIGE